MARLPDIQGARPVARPSRAIASISPKAAAAPRQALEGIGQQVSQFGDVLFDRETTAQATERDTMLSNQIRDLIYNPETGFASMKGDQAVGARKRTLDQLEALRASAYDGLNGTAKRKLESSLTRRLSGAMDTVERHTLGERDNWLAGASAARVEAAYQDSLFNPADTAASLSVIENEVRAQGIREGWGSERTQVELDAKRSKLFHDQAIRIASADPIAAMEYMRNNQDRMVASDVVNLETKLQPEIKKAIGRQKGAAAAGGMPAYNHSTSISYSMGPARPYAPEKPILDVIGKSVEDVLGAGAKIVVTSGQEGDKRQHGSNRHKTGHAADVKIIRPDGTVVKATDPEMALIAKASAANGAKGVGFGAEYMGGEHIHIDLVEPGAGQSNTWASGGTGIRDEFVSTIRNRLDAGAGATDLDAILAIEDPTERAAALTEYDLITSARSGQQKAALASAQDAAFQMITAGGNVGDLPIDVQQALGQTAMTSLYSYQSILAKGDVVETDPATYYELRQLQAVNPQGFRNLNLVEYRDRLDNTDWQKMVDDQTKPSSDITTAAASTLMTTASRQMTAAGIDATPKPGSDDASTVATLQSRLLRWQDGFVAENKRAPTQTEIDDRIGRELLPVLIDPKGLMNKTEATLSQLEGLDLSADNLATSTITVLDTEVPPAVINEQIIALQEAGIPVTADALLDRIVSMFEAAGLR